MVQGGFHLSLLWGKASGRKGRNESSNMERTGKQEGQVSSLSKAWPGSCTYHCHALPISQDWLTCVQNPAARKVGEYSFYAGKAVLLCEKRGRLTLEDGCMWMRAVRTEGPPRRNEDEDLTTPTRERVTSKMDNGKKCWGNPYFHPCKSSCLKCPPISFLISPGPIYAWFPHGGLYWQLQSFLGLDKKSLSGLLTGPIWL